MGKSKNKDASARLSQSHPMAGRKTLYTLENKEGEVVALDSTNFGIRPVKGKEVLLPVNLPEELRESGIRIKFTGQVKETGLTELWAGQPLLLSTAEKI